MRIPAILLICLFFSSFAFSQINSSDTTLFFSSRNIFSNACIHHLSKQYRVRIQTVPQTCYSLPEYAPDSIKKNNERVSRLMLSKNGEDWLSKLEKELYACEETTCMSDSVSKYIYYHGLGVTGILMSPFSSSLTETQKCIIRNTTLVSLNEYPKLRLEIQSYTIAGEEEFSVVRANSVRNFLIAEGVDPSRLTIMDYKTENQLFTSEPNDMKNCQVLFKATSY